MAKQIIDLGTPPKGTDGDTSRVAFEKAQQNFDELYARAQEKLSKDVSGGAGVLSLSDSEALNGFIDLTGLLTGAREVTVSASPPQPYTVRNSTTGAFDVTFRTASGSGVKIPAGRALMLFSDGTNIVDPVSTVPGRLIAVRVLTSSGTYTPTPGTTSIIVEGQGAGGAGSGSVAPASGNFNCGSGGAAGGYFKHRMTSGFSSVAVVIGAAGIPVVGGSGGAGGATSFGSLTAAGGLGGYIGLNGVNSSAVPPAGGGAAGGNLLNIAGEPGNSSMLGQNGALYVFGRGGSSMLGVGGACGNGVNGSGASGYGAGGGGTVNSTNSPIAGGSPSPGCVVVWEYA